MRFIFKNKQVEYGTITGGKLAYKLHQYLLRNSIHRRSIRLLIRLRHIVQGSGLAHHIILPQILQYRIHHYTFHPSPQRTLSPPRELIERVEELQETVMHQILCSFPVTGVTQTYAEHPPRILFVQFFAGKVVALPATFCQYLFFHPLF